MACSKFDFSSERVVFGQSGTCVVSIQAHENLLFSGYVVIEVQKGRVEINGFIIENDNNCYKLYSIPFWKDNCLSINAQSNALIKLYPFNLKAKYRIKKTSKTCDAVFKILGCHFITEPQNEYKALITPLSWQKCATHLVKSSNQNNKNQKNKSNYHQSMTAMLCGRIRSGKSTFSRYLTNRLLNKHKQIAYLDCDVGQGEFTPEGMIAITIIDQPIFGEPHTHQHCMGNDNNKCWKAYYYGSNNPMDDPSLYLKYVCKLFHDWTHRNTDDSNDDIPLVVNTHGWVTRLGAHILKTLIANINPDHLIEITNTDKPLLHGVEMDYLAEIKDIFVHQNKSHDWSNKAITNDDDSDKNNKVQSTSLISSWWTQLTNKDDMKMKDYNELKPKQKEWSKYFGELVKLNFEFDGYSDGSANWFDDINVKSALKKNSKSKHEIQLLKAFVHAHLHFVQSVTYDKENEENNADIGKDKYDDDKVKQLIAKRKERKFSTVQKRLLSMVSYFTQELFTQKPAKYLRDTDCYKVSFDSVSVVFLNQNINISNQALVLHALNGVMVGLGVCNDCYTENKPNMKKRKLNNDQNYLNIIDNHDGNNSDNFECLGLGIIRSINFVKKIFYVITPLNSIQSNKINLFIRGKTAMPSILINDSSSLAAPLYVNCIPSKEKIFRSTC